MSRSVAWRRQLSDAASWHQDEALNATIYILREMGPTGFLLKEEGETKKYKVYLGDPHSCTCHTFMKERDLCKHICWVLLRKFRVPRQNEVTWQLGLVEREVNEILRGAAARREVKPSATAQHRAREAASGAGDGDGDEDQPEEGIQQRPIKDDDVCPICQEEFFDKHLPVTYCKFGCGNNIHIKCMKVWADHQKTQGETNIKCPLCREDFGPFSLLQEEMRNSSTRGTKAERLGQHLGTTCKQCRVAPIVGKCYKCTVCADYHLCQNCFITPVHQSHNFEYREKPSQRWREAQRGTGSVLPPAVVSAMMSRDLGDADYDMLLQLDNQAAVAASDLSEETVRTFPTERVRKNGLLLAPGQQCRVCLQRYTEGQYVKKLPCRHKFHKDCIDNWLLHQHATCPVDGMVFTNDSVRAYREAERIRKQQHRESNNRGSSNSTSQAVENSGGLQLHIPGVGIASQSQHARGSGSLLSGHLSRGQAVVADTAGILVSGTSYTSGTADGLTEALSSIQTASRLQQPATVSPVVPVPPSIPRPHDGIHLGIGTESPQHRPPSGTQRDRGSAGHGRGRSRTRGRPGHSTTGTRQRSGSRTRDQSSERTHIDPNLYLGHRDADLLTNETNRDVISREQPRRNSGAHSRRVQSSDAHTGAGIQSHERSAARQGPLRTRPRDQSARQTESRDNTQLMGELHIGNNETASSQTPHGSPARLRHGLTGLTGLTGAANSRDQTHPRNHLGSSPEGRLTAGQSSPNSLYVGADPASSEGFLKQFLLNSIARKNSAKAPNRTATSREPAREADRRWGEVREMSGDRNTIMLSGTRVQSEGSS